MPVDARPVPANNRAMSVADQARYPGSALCRFLHSRLPQRGAVAEDWAWRTASAPWTPVSLPEEENRTWVPLSHAPRSLAVNPNDR